MKNIIGKVLFFFLLGVVAFGQGNNGNGVSAGGGGDVIDYIFGGIKDTIKGLDDRDSIIVNTFQFKFANGTIKNEYRDTFKVFIDVVDDYYTMRLLEGSRFESQFQVKDSYHTDWQGKSYIRRGGTFYKDENCTENCTENGGTVIVGNDGTVYKRVWDGINIWPSWWEMLGVDANGNSYIDAKISSLGISTVVEAINSAAIVGGTGAIIHLEKDLLYEDIDVSIRLWDLQKLVGHGSSKLKRIGDLGHTYTQVGNVITVPDGSLYRKDQVLIFGGVSDSDIDPVDEAVVLAVSGNELTLDITPATPPTGQNNVYFNVTVVNCFLGNSSSSNEIYDIIFDGNESNVFHRGWRHSVMISGSTGAFTSERGIHIHNCQFLNYANEAIFAGSGHIYNNYAENGGGSFIHAAFDKLPQNGILSVEESAKYQLIIEGNTLYNVRTNTDEESVHSEGGLLTFSSVCPNIKVLNNEVTNSGGGFVGLYDPNDHNLLIQGNTGKNCKNYIIQIVSGNAGKKSGLRILDNFFYSCGDIAADGTEVNRISNIVIDNNTIANGRIQMTATDGIQITNNRLGIVQGLYGFNGFERGIYGWGAAVGSKKLDPVGSFVSFYRCSNVNFSNNYIFGDPNSLHDDQYLSAVYFHNIELDPSSADFIDSTYLHVDDNHIYNFRRGITFENDPFDVSAKQLISASANRNEVVMFNDLPTERNWGISLYAGADAIGNKVIMNQGIASLYTYGIRSSGVANGKETFLRAGKIKYNEIEGGVTSSNNFAIYVVGNNNWITNNHHWLGIQNSGTGTYIFQNISISAALTNYTAPAQFPRNIVFDLQEFEN